MAGFSHAVCEDDGPFDLLVDCYATGSVSGTSCVGGLVGTDSLSIDYSTFNTYSINRCYAAGLVTASSEFGGLVGRAYSWSTVINAYWNVQTSGQALSARGVGLSTVQMKTAGSFEGWDFESVWGIEGGYPYLKNLPASTLTYAASVNGQVADEVTTGSSLTQVVNTGATGTPVQAIPDTGRTFIKWDDEVTSLMRTDIAPATNKTFTALFSKDNSVRRWTPYE